MLFHELSSGEVFFFFSIQTSIEDHQTFLQIVPVAVSAVSADPEILETVLDLAVCLYVVVLQQRQIQSYV